VGVSQIWQPPEYNGQSEIIQNPPNQLIHPHQTRAYLFDGIQVNPCDYSSITDPNQFYLLRITSAYQDHGRIWVYHRDVTNPQPDEDQNNFIYWRNLSFRWPTYVDERQRTHHYGHSTACVTYGQEERLYAVREDQQWHHKLLPQPYHPGESQRRRMRNRPPPCGSLNGDLSLLIALVAFSAEPTGNHVENALIHCIQQGSWDTPPGNVGDGCKFISLECAV
jgi:hypothetical protein